MEKNTILSQRYELLSFLGRGGMSEVWKARHIHLDKLVAIKLLNRDLLGKQEFQARFKQEAQIASKLNHPNICAVSDFGFTEDGTPFIVMEFLEGESLASVLKRIERLPVGASLLIAKHTMQGLQAAHSIGVVHRDIKPGNIYLVKEKGGTRISKILDFGISKMVSGGKTDLGLTTTGTLLGTAFYLSPEQIMESRTVDHRTDIYACGAVLYKMITGKVPFHGENFGEVAVKVVNDPLIDPRNLVAGLPGNVAKIIKKCMEKEARLRYADAGECLQDIEKALEEFQGDTIEALYKPGIENLILKPIEKKPTRFTRKSKIAFITGLLLMLIGGGVVTGFFAFNGKNTEKSKNSSIHALAQKQNKPAGLNSENIVQVNENKETQKVKIKLKSLPVNAIITDGKERYTGDVILLTKSSNPMTLTISAEGFDSKEITVVPLMDMELDATLKMSTTKTEEVIKPTPQMGLVEKTKAKTQVEKRTGEEKKKKGKMDFMREF